MKQLNIIGIIFITILFLLGVRGEIIWKFSDKDTVKGYVLKHWKMSRGSNMLTIEYVIEDKYYKTNRSTSYEAKRYVGDSCVIKYVKNHPKVVRVIDFIEVD